MVTRGRTKPLGICDHCGTIGRIWSYGGPELGEEAEICYQCIRAVIASLGQDTEFPY